MTLKQNNVTLDQTVLSRIDLQHWSTKPPAYQGFPDVEAAHYSLQTNGQNSLTIANVWIAKSVLTSLNSQ